MRIRSVIRMWMHSRTRPAAPLRSGQKKRRLGPALAAGALVVLLVEPPELGAREPEASETEWSPYAPVHRPTPPAVDDPAWSANPVDAFVFARLNEAGLAPAPPVGRRTWIRRVTFDLTGLPPTPAEVESFLTDPARDPEAYGKVVDRLLASPAYGEQKARRWLDVVRYADTDGYAIDGERYTLWRYRDYVIRSWNEDRPFDEFAREQIAGDLLPGTDDASRSRGLVATGFLRLGPWEADNMVPRDRRQDYLNEITSTTGTVFLGLTVGCARCHNHKYDPISLSEYYSLQAFFGAAQRRDRPASYGADELPPHLRAKQAAARAERERRAKALAEYRRNLKDVLARTNGGSKESNDARPGEQRKGETSRKAVTDKELDAALARDEPFTKDQKSRHAQLKKALDDYSTAQRYEATVASIEPVAGDKVQKTFVLRGGDLTSPGAEVTPRFISALGAVDASLVSALSASVEQTRQRRRLLAEWVASADNPLTARVLVNRIWQQHFVRGLVATTNNFGKSGSGVSHPELLDYLAAEFVAGGWRSKPVHRLIALSRAYRSARVHPDAAKCETVDPENRLLWRAHPRRLAAEELRDAMLSVSGQLRREHGGPGFREELPEELGTKFPFFDWVASSELERRRRSVYHFQRRNMTLPFFEVFDACHRSEPCDERGVSVVATQALAMLNGRFAVARSRDLARRLQREAPGDLRAQVRRLFELAFGRRPTDREYEAYVSTYERHRAGFVASEGHSRKDGRSSDTAAGLAGAESPETRALADLCLVTLNTNEFLYLD